MTGRTPRRRSHVRERMMHSETNPIQGSADDDARGGAVAVTQAAEPNDANGVESIRVPNEALDAGATTVSPIAEKAPSRITRPGAYPGKRWWLLAVVSARTNAHFCHRAANSNALKALRKLA